MATAIGCAINDFIRGRVAQIIIAAIPEPSTILHFGFGLMVLQSVAEEGKIVMLVSALHGRGPQLFGYGIIRQ